MLGRSFRIGRLFGIDLTVSWSFLALVAVLALYLAIGSGNFILGLLTAAVSLALVFASITAHELGHSLVARHLGVRIAEIELHFFGGAAKMLSMPKGPRQEILISAAGPIVSFVLAGLFLGVTALGFNPYGISSGLASINLVLGAFNLIPALPTDGGRILRAALAIRYGQLRATRIAVKVARVATIGIGAWALLSGNFFALGIALFLWMLGTRELKMAEMLYAGRGGWMPDQRYERRSESPQVEVFDRLGNFIGTAPGGADQVTRSKVEPTQPQSPRSHRPREHTTIGAGRRTVVRGADGRLWVISTPS